MPLESSPLDSFPEHDETQAPPEPVVVSDNEIPPTPDVYEVPDDTILELAPKNQPLESFRAQVRTLIDQGLEWEGNIAKLKPEVLLGLDIVTLEEAKKRIELGRNTFEQGDLDFALGANLAATRKIQEELGERQRIDTKAGLLFALTAKTARDIVKAGNPIEEAGKYIDTQVKEYARKQPVERVI